MMTNTTKYLLRTEHTSDREAHILHPHQPSWPIPIPLGLPGTYPGLALEVSSPRQAKRLGGSNQPSEIGAVTIPH